MTTQPRPDDLRERLKTLGYLNAPVDRFVLGSAANRRTSAALAATASGRIGLLAGVLLGPAAALGLASKLPELITSPADAGVIAAYLAAVFGVIVAVAAFAVILPAGLAARALAGSPRFASRARRLAAGAGVLIFLGLLAYLTLWWRAAVSTPTPTFSLAALALAVATSAVLGHTVTVTALAFVARLDPTLDLGAGVPLSSWRAIVPMAGIAFGGAAWLLFAAAPGRQSGPPAPTLTVVPTGERVLVLAIDGVDLTLFDRLTGAGALPALARLTGGATASLASDPDRDPARVWTTIATGQPAARHGINALEGRQLTGVDGRLSGSTSLGARLAGATDLLRLTRPALASDTERRLPAFWEAAARAGLRTSVLHWWATWPAAREGDDAGTVLTDRALLRLEQGGMLDAEIAPASLYSRLEATWADRRRRAATDAASAVPPDADPAIASALARSASIDATLVDLADDSDLSAGDLEVVYLPGLDIAQHALLSPVEGAALPPSAVAERVAALEGYYQFLDRLVTRLTAARRSVLLVTQPGRIASPGPGLLALTGPPAAAGRARGEATPESVAATALYLLGVPVADDLAASVAPVVSAAFRAAHPARHIPTYGLRRVGPRARTGQALDQEMIERMRSLGYVR